MTLKVGIMGATGYTGYELVQIVRRHPAAEIVWLTSKSFAGQKLSAIYPTPYQDRLIAAEQVDLATADVVFLCLPHAASQDKVAWVRAAGPVAIDLSADFRLHDPAVYQKWYATPQHQQTLLAEAVYGLPEIYRQHIKEAKLIANPGCYPTSINLALYPLAKMALLGEQIIVDSKSGVSGAGRTPQASNHFVTVNGNLKPYSVGYRHRHIAEVEQLLDDIAPGRPRQVTFVPHLLPVSRGILSTIYVTVPLDWDSARVRSLYAETYAGEPFIQLLPPEEPATLHHTVGSNRCALGISTVRPGQLVLTASIDNLLKGASGQAVQNMNIAFGLPETAGLL